MGVEEGAQRWTTSNAEGAISKREQISRWCERSMQLKQVND